MRIEQKSFSEENGWINNSPGNTLSDADLVFVFGSSGLLKSRKGFTDIRGFYSSAVILGCSSAGEIIDTHVNDDTLSVTAVKFEKAYVKLSRMLLSECSGSYDAGEKIARQIEKNGLRHVFVLSDGLSVNGGELVKGIAGNLPAGVGLTGGLAGDGSRFIETFTFADNEPQEGLIAVLAFYGEGLKVGYSSVGGWDSFGPERLITKSESTVLFEMDGHPALDIYKKYLGPQAAGLPATALHFPLSLKISQDSEAVVRTPLKVDEKNRAMIFAGDLPEGAYVRFMKANNEKLIDGAISAARIAVDFVEGFKPELALLISCIGRRLVLKQRTEEEIEGIREVLGNSVAFTGFYSYGEISPFFLNGKCELHNQSMTITVFSEL